MASLHEEEVLGKAYDSRLMKRLLKYLRPYKWQVAVALAAIVLKAGADVLGPYLTKVAIDKYLASATGASFVARPLAESAAAVPALRRSRRCMLVLIVFSFLLEYLQTYLMQWTGQKVMFDLRSQIFRHLQRMHIGFYDKNPVGRLVTRVTTDVDALNEMFTSGVVSIFEDVFVLAGIMVIMLRMNWRLALITFAVLPFIVDRHADFPRQGARLLPAHSRGHRAHQRLSCKSTSAAWSVLQLFNREQRAFEKFSEVERAFTWTRSRTPSWPTPSITRWWKFCLPLPLPASSGSAETT